MSAKDFSLTTATQDSPLETAMKVVFQWDYDAELEKVRRLYVKATEAQWIAERDLDWTREIDIEKFSPAPLVTSIPLVHSSYWRSLEPDVLRRATRRLAGFRLSQFLHGEQAALMVAGQLVNTIPHIDAKLYAATQTMDEARHVEAFSRYVAKLDGVHPIAPAFKRVLTGTLETSDWMKKLVGMQIVVEGLALFNFNEMRALTEEPLLKQILSYVTRDESRHHAYGVQYISRCVPQLSSADREALEDFAFEAACGLIGPRAGAFLPLIPLLADSGIDPVELFGRLKRESEDIAANRSRDGSFAPFRDFVIPTLRRCGLLSERLAGRLHAFVADNVGAELAGESVEEFLKHIPEIPEDTAAWLLKELR